MGKRGRQKRGEVHQLVVSVAARRPPCTETLSPPLPSLPLSWVNATGFNCLLPIESPDMQIVSRVEWYMHGNVQCGCKVSTTGDGLAPPTA